MHRKISISKRCAGLESKNWTLLMFLGVSERNPVPKSPEILRTRKKNCFFTLHNNLREKNPSSLIVHVLGRNLKSLQLPNQFKKNPVSTAHTFYESRNWNYSHFSSKNSIFTVPDVSTRRNPKFLQLFHLTRKNPISTLSDVSGLKNWNSEKDPSEPLPQISPPRDGLLRRNWTALPLPHRTIQEPRGQDLDFVNVCYSHLIHTDWAKLDALANGLTPFRIKHILLKIHRDPVLSLEFFDWVQLQKPNSHTLDAFSILLHILTKAKKFRIAETLLKKSLIPKTQDSPSDLFDSLVYTYHLCESSNRVFDALFKTYAHLKKLRNATDTFCRMKDYGFLPTVESCNAYMSSSLDLRRTDIVLAFYREILRCRISPNVYTLNMVICALCKSGKLEKAVEVFREMEGMGCRPNTVSYNTLIDGYCRHRLLPAAVKLKDMMRRKGVEPNIVTYNTLIHGFCKEGKLLDANKLFSEMKAMDVAPNTVTYNTLINGYSQQNNSEMGAQLREEMVKNGVPIDILTYNAQILGLCKEGKTKKASFLLKELDRENLVPNASTFSALITGQCKRQNAERAYQLYKNMKRRGWHPSSDTFRMLVSVFCKNEDFEGAVQILREMLERALAPDVAMLVELFEGLCRYGKDKLATRLCMEVEEKRLLPKEFDKGVFMNYQLEKVNSRNDSVS